MVKDFISKLNIFRQHSLNSTVSMAKIFSTLSHKAASTPFPWTYSRAVHFIGEIAMGRTELLANRANRTRCVGTEWLETSLKIGSAMQAVLVHLHTGVPIGFRFSTQWSLVIDDSFDLLLRQSHRSTLPWHRCSSSLWRMSSIKAPAPADEILVRVTTGCTLSVPSSSSTCSFSTNIYFLLFSRVSGAAAQQFRRKWSISLSSK